VSGKSAVEVKHEGEAEWNELLGTIRVVGREREKRIFYSSL
jgi:putative alpha-1,2-mannosidase